MPAHYDTEDVDRPWFCDDQTACYMHGTSAHDICNSTRAYASPNLVTARLLSDAGHFCADGPDGPIVAHFGSAPSISVPFTTIRYSTRV